MPRGASQTIHSIMILRYHYSANCQGILLKISNDITIKEASKQSCNQSYEGERNEK